MTVTVSPGDPVSFNAEAALIAVPSRSVWPSDPASIDSMFIYLVLLSAAIAAIFAAPG
jgi:hypothetical protein